MSKRINKKSTKVLRSTKQKIKAAKALDIEALRVLWALTKIADADFGHGLVDSAYENAVATEITHLTPEPTPKPAWEIMKITPEGFDAAIDRLLESGLVKRVHTYRFDADLVFYNLAFNYSPEQFEVVQAVRQLAIEAGGQR